MVALGRQGPGSRSLGGPSQQHGRGAEGNAELEETGWGQGRHPRTQEGWQRSARSPASQKSSRQTQPAHRAWRGPGEWQPRMLHTAATGAISRGLQDPGRAAQPSPVWVRVSKRKARLAQMIGKSNCCSREGWVEHEAGEVEALGKDSRQAAGCEPHPPHFLAHQDSGEATGPAQGRS